MANQVERAIEVLVADFLRQGSFINIDQVNRVLERRGLDAAQSASVIRALAEQGVDITGVDPSTLGFHSDRPEMGSSFEKAGGCDTLGDFLKEIGRYRLLTARDEQALGRRIELGRRALAELEHRLGVTPFGEPSGSLARRFQAVVASSMRCKSGRMRVPH